MSLYHIEENLLRIFAEIEANEGELTDELAAQLDLTKDNLKVKLDGYIKAIKSWEGDIAVINGEIEKLNKNADIKANRVKRLKAAMLTAVELFGDDGKSGNKFIDLPTCKIFTKSSTSTEVNGGRIQVLMNEFDRYVRELADNGILYTGADVELQGILDSINGNLKAEHEFNIEQQYGTLIYPDGEKEFIPYTLADLTTIQIQVSTTQSIYHLFRSGIDALNLYTKNPHNTILKDSTSKTDWKEAIGIADTINLNQSATENNTEPLYSYPTVASIKKSNSLQIK